MALANTYAYIGSVGPASAASGATPLARLGLSGEQVVQELHGRYYETCYRKNLFYATAQTFLLFGIPALAQNGFILWNRTPGINVVLQKINLQVSASSGTMTGIALCVGTAGSQTTAPSTSTAITGNAGGSIGGCFLGTNPTAIAYQAGTVIAIPTAIIPILHNTAGIATSSADMFWVDLEGSVIIPPMTTMVLAALGANSAANAVSCSVLWEEVPV